MRWHEQPEGHLSDRNGPDGGPQLNAPRAGLTWLLPDGLDDAEPECRLYPAAVAVEEQAARSPTGLSFTPR
jgi:hypothetical protein